MISPQEKLIFPLDFPEKEEALAWVHRLSPYVGVFKIGLELFTKEGPQLIEEIKKITSAKIFLDLKLCDIPNTVAGAVRSISSLGVDFLTLHILSGRKALETAIQSAQGGLKLFGVTILTSLDRGDLLELGFSGELAGEIEDLVLKLTRLAYSIGMDGVVASAKELALLKEHFPNFLVIVPGIRKEKGLDDDQQRTATPYQAILKGADYLVIGRPIRLAENPEREVEKILEEIEMALKERKCLEKLS